MSNDELNRYDRQIRAWGFETQRRLHSCKFLFLGLNEASLECMKNLILAGAAEVSFTDTEDAIEKYSTNIKFMTDLNPLCPANLIQLDTVLSADRSGLIQEEIEKYDFLCIFKSTIDLIKQASQSQKTILISFGKAGDIIYLQPEYSPVSENAEFSPLEQTVFGALLSQVIVDHLPPIEQPIAYRLVYDPINLSSSVQQI
ncbi:hypothetical protein TRFO_19923 [Tritrichomonas foetus]|uniref:THIF-type NAD/FAD binding fold domain-containing protein n=1 Tax=Tritrichomonas foetus TaxID=1144522 RepID=A0A1J4KH77_9EUKA|nr:hypothetical protein TRFO_19923 [Tritrichomonas foetus]|eukprot:OHT10705.1 hypothetical protein TRFO_19923 [Tritrichomonas foetus]